VLQHLIAFRSKLMSLVRWLAFAFSIAAWMQLSAISAVAMPNLSRQISGRIVGIDLEKRSLRITADEGKSTLDFVWSERTKFFDKSGEAKAADLVLGRTVEIVYRAPLIGQRSAHRVRWNSSATSKSSCQDVLVE
jgi:hypothetical protein